MTSAVEKHQQLLAEGWTTRIDGLLRPPRHWADQRPRTPAAAWHDHEQAEQQPKEQTA